jgi:hypothetical protein
MTKNPGFSYDRPARTERTRGSRVASYAFDVVFPFVLICLAYSVSRYYFMG